MLFWFTLLFLLCELLLYTICACVCSLLIFYFCHFEIFLNLISHLFWYLKFYSFSLLFHKALSAVCIRLCVFPVSSLFLKWHFYCQLFLEFYNLITNFLFFWFMFFFHLSIISLISFGSFQSFRLQFPSVL